MNEHLDSSIEAKLLAIGNKRYHKAMILTWAWIAVVIVGWLFWMIWKSRAFSLVPNYLPLILCALPFFPFRAHKILFAKTFYATIDHTVNDTQFQQLKEAYFKNRPDTKDVFILKLKKDNGALTTLTYEKKNDIMDGLHYTEGMRVLLVRGLNYPIPLPITDTTKRTCPRCGRTVDVGETTCSRCQFDYSQLF